MKITVAGAGYVGLVTSACLSELGHKVTCIDAQKVKTDMFQNGSSPIYEPGLLPLLEKSLRNGQLNFTIDTEQAFSDCDIVFIAAGTPEKHDGTVDLTYVYDISKIIAYSIKKDVIICTKSTVPVGTNNSIKDFLQSYKPPNLQIEVVSNPEFLREGLAILDFFQGDQIVIGSDTRIGHAYLQAGIGYGSSCFPKDTKALIQLAGTFEHQFELLYAAIKANTHQHSLPVKKAMEMFGTLEGKKVALLGLAFKPDTDDIREAASFTIVDDLRREGAYVTAYDPIAIPNAKKALGNSIKYAWNIREALVDADIAIIATEWDQIKHIPLSMYCTYMKEPIVIDGRNCYRLEEISKYPIIYRSVGRPDVNQLTQIRV